MRTIVLIALAYSLAMRGFEIYWSRRNAKIVGSRGARFFRDDGFLLIAAVHTIWFLLFMIEEWKVGPRLFDQKWLTGGAVCFVIAELARFWCMYILKEQWNIRVVRMIGAPIVRRGPYRFLRHPNYASAILTLFALPLALGLVSTAISVLPFHIWAIVRRIKIENIALAMPS
jgi:methyltransferase